MRQKIIRLTVFSLFALVALDLVYLQVIRGPYYYSLSTNNRIRVVPTDAQRGRILDRNGIAMAENRLSFDVAVIPQDIQDNDKLFDFLSEALKTDKTKLLQRFWQRKVTPFAPVVIAEDVDKKTAMVLEENRFRFPGLYIQEDFRRYYPFGETGAHVLGYVGKINRVKMEKLKEYGYTPLSVIGYSGVEEYYDQYLVGKEGGQQIEVDSRGRQMRLLGIREPQKGEDIQLTIDMQIQQIADGILKGHNGAVVVMDLDSGEILALASSPSYDPNIFSSRRLSYKIGSVQTDASAPLLNRAIKGQYPPGSVFKAVGAVTGLVTGKVTAQTPIESPGYYQLGRRRFHCTAPPGTYDLPKAIERSCNVYFYNVGLMVGAENLAKYARMFGLGQPTNIDLPFEEKGFVPGPEVRRRQNEAWPKGDTLNMSIGQGELLTTPLQLTRMMATVALDGREVQPHLIKKIGDKEIISLSATRQLPVDPAVFKPVKEGLRRVVNGTIGTARLLNIQGLTISGKTGTAQSVPNKEHHAWFVGYETSGKPRLAFCVFLEHGGSSHNSVALTKQLFEEMKKAGVI